MTKRSKAIWGILIIVILIAAAGGCFYFWRVWWPMKQAQIGLGLASSKFPWRSYTLEELNKMYPQIKNADVPTRITPEETYAKFREALRTNDLELALEQLSKESKSYLDNKADIEEAYQEKKFSVIYAEYSENLEKTYMYESIAQYYFIENKNTKKTIYPINFIKDSSGDWKMDSL